MNTDQENVKQLIGDENYNLLIQNGYFPIEIESLKILLKHQTVIENLRDRISQIEKQKNSMFDELIKSSFGTHPNT